MVHVFCTLSNSALQTLYRADVVTVLTYAWTIFIAQMTGNRSYQLYTEVKHATELDDSETTPHLP